MQPAPVLCVAAPWGRRSRCGCPMIPQVLGGCTLVVLAVPEMHLVLLASLQQSQARRCAGRVLAVFFWLFCCWWFPAVCTGLKKAAACGY